MPHPQRLGDQTSARCSGSHPRSISSFRGRAGNRAAAKIVLELLLGRLDHPAECAIGRSLVLGQFFQIDDLLCPIEPAAPVSAFCPNPSCHPPPTAGILFQTAGRPIFYMPCNRPATGRLQNRKDRAPRPRPNCASRPASNEGRSCFRGLSRIASWIKPLHFGPVIPKPSRTAASLPRCLYAVNPTRARSASLNNGSGKAPGICPCANSAGARTSATGASPGDCWKASMLIRRIMVVRSMTDRVVNIPLSANIGPRQRLTSLSSSKSAIAPVRKARTRRKCNPAVAARYYWWRCL